jgi:hypothetical protein
VRDGVLPSFGRRVEPRMPSPAVGDQVDSIRIGGDGALGDGQVGA